MEELMQRTATSGTTVTSRYLHDPVVDVESHERLARLLLAIDMVGIVWCVRVATGLLDTREPLEDQTATHWDNVGRTPCTIMIDASYWKVVFHCYEIEGREKRNDVSVVHTIGELVGMKEVIVCRRTS